MDIPFEFISNITNDTSATYYKTEEIEEKPDVIPGQVPPGVTIIFIIAGTVGNGLVCLAILLNRKLQNLMNYFLFSLAVTDLLVCILVLPARLLAVRYELEPPMFPLCFLYLVGDDFITAASAIHICFISVDRYLAIKYPFNRGNITRRKITIQIALVWIIAFLTIIPYTTFAIITEHPNEPKLCPYLLANFVSYETVALIEVLVILVMVVVVVVSFILTTILLHRLVKMQEANTSNGDCGLVRTVGGKMDGIKANNKNAHQALQSEKKAMRVIWLVSFTFIICMLPYTYIIFQFLLFPDVIIPNVLLEVTVYLYYLSSVVNPIIYTIFNKTFRDDFRNLILCKYKRK